MAKAEISWKRVTPEGDKLQVYAQRVGGRWLFYTRHRRYEQWRSLPDPPLEDWMELLDAVRRRVARRLLKPEETAWVEQAMREQYPDAPPQP